MDPIRILLTDDHLIIRNGIKQMLKRHKQFKVVAEAGSGIEAINYLDKNYNDIDVVLMDIDMPEMNGIDATKVITNSFENIKVLVLSVHNEEPYIKSVIDAGASGYALKDADTSEIVSAIESIASGKKYFSSEVSNIMIDSLMNKQKEQTIETDGLTEREVDVIKLVASGATNKEVSDKLFISSRTVETHRRNIMDKLGLNNLAELIKYAIKKGYVSVD
ncbi:MAG: response regulator transcription factor [Flavobacteriales bacterium]|jgi:DNA-binding NarL/FixJ family response regulator|nr:response regulator transcription factor [Flavobacteriales bacterium]MCW8912589.1 response regulator transcription factor [Flavobacteriales bacterium]MCW8938194.1 response regulator transcription factor [Flavobacteriales bacterium]MCW8941026.1 response regulator transcription factor [Flavobacteriales bacterium]MCW8967014.1 response regulator transcription factor [Flavobacteriales bacterium]